MFAILKKNCYKKIVAYSNNHGNGRKSTSEDNTQAQLQILY